jgi:hypothetical protein
MAVQNSVGSHQETFEGSMNLYGINGILRTGRNMPAGGRSQRRDGSTVKINRQQHDLYQNPSESICNFFDHLALWKLIIPQIQDEVTQKMKEKRQCGVVVSVIFCCSAGYIIQTFHNFPSFPTFILKETVRGVRVQSKIRIRKSKISN